MRDTPDSERVSDRGSGGLASYDAVTVVRPAVVVRAALVRTWRPGRLLALVPREKVTDSRTRPLPAAARAATSKTVLSSWRRTDGVSGGTTQMWVGVATCSTGRPRWGEPGASAAVLLPSLEVLSSTRSPVTRVTVWTPGLMAAGRARLAVGVLAADEAACAGSGSTPAAA